MTKATVFNIQRYSLNDGPGIRTTVFFKGCPLQCWWCHNPESQSYKINLIKYPHKCIQCNRCITICEYPNDCHFCGACAKICPTEALQMVGKEMTVQYLYEEIIKDRLFYEESGGGVTFSGGEPLSQHEFLINILKLCKHNEIHTAVDTSGYCDTNIIKEVANYTDLWLYDIKHLNEDKHKHLTGVSNKIILNNLKTLVSLGSSIKVRVPIIPTYNDQLENIKALGSYLATIGLFNVNILPYHTLAEDKHSRFSMQYKLKHLNEPSEEYMKSIKNTLESYGLNVIIGG
ncbi:glycyl-radical enzyme activating protein [Clostridium sp. 'deep sea']|uniref:glycyl-radical enzyme activating protein n=1 Tax=Clostridium sp. 'deep sea' TaxID=2779445 RepID=UPI0018968DC4|nr:glycyl-radical enzyme activating protein [Clostridium sp. 'deep sea']QOR34747.1 glycyl-radical enzyme activating protein [Clostridium sp. 'deep sea']